MSWQSYRAIDGDNGKGLSDMHYTVTPTKEHLHNHIALTVEVLAKNCGIILIHAMHSVYSNKFALFRLVFYLDPRFQCILTSSTNHPKIGSPETPLWRYKSNVTSEIFCVIVDHLKMTWCYRRGFDNHLLNAVHLPSGTSEKKRPTSFLIRPNARSDDANVTSNVCFQSAHDCHS